MRCLSRTESKQWQRAHASRSRWKRQLTCHTPLDRLPWFTSVLVDHLQPFNHALLVVDEVIFEVPKLLRSLREAADEPRDCRECPGHLVDRDAAMFRALLEAALSGWLDFRVFLTPKAHALRCDHDEYTTIFSMSSGKIADIRKSLQAGGVGMVDDHTAESP